MSKDKLRRTEKELAAVTARLVLLSRAEERVAAVSAEAEADFARKRDENRELSAKAAIFFCCEILCRAMSRHLLKKKTGFFSAERRGARCLA